MDIKQLEIFVKIVDTGSFSRAAESVFLTQPTVSGHIISLEKELGIKLLDRLGREVVPTKAGKVLYNYAKKMVALRDEATQAVTQLTGRMKGEVVIGGSTIPGEYVIPKVVGKFKELYPDITVVLKIGDTSDIVHKVLEGECEIGVVGFKCSDNKLDCIEFIEDELVLIAAAGYRLPHKKGVSANELSGLPFVMRERGSGSRMAIESCMAEMGMDPYKINIVAEMGSTEAVKQAVKNGLGVSLVSSLAVVDDTRQKTIQVIPFKGKRFLRKFFIITRHGRNISPIAEALLKFLPGSIKGTE